MIGVDVIHLLCVIRSYGGTSLNLVLLLSSCLSVRFVDFGPTKHSSEKRVPGTHVRNSRDTVFRNLEDTCRVPILLGKELQT